MTKFFGSKIEELCFKLECISMKCGIKKHGTKGKASEMKNIKNISLKSEWLGEVDSTALTQEIKDDVLLLASCRASMTTLHIENGYF